MDDLTLKDKKTLNFVSQFQEKNGFSPSLEEIKTAIGTKSTRGASLHLSKLSKLNYIMRDPNARRAIKILIKPKSLKSEMVKAPIVGEVKAGYGGLTEQKNEGYRQVPISLTGGRRNVVLLKIRGDSMTRAGFNPGDLAIVVPQSSAFDGDIVVVLDPETNEETLKRFKKMRNYMILFPESFNPDYLPKIGSQFIIQGKVIGKI